MSLFKRKLTVCQAANNIQANGQKFGLSSKHSKRQFLSVMTSRTRISFNDLQSQQHAGSRVNAQCSQKGRQEESFWLNPCEKAQNICENDIIFHDKEEIMETEINLPTRSSTHDLKAKKVKSFYSKPNTPVNKLKESQFLTEKLDIESVQISRVQLFNQGQMKFLLNH